MTANKSAPTFPELLEGASPGPWTSVKAEAYNEFTHIFISNARGAIGHSPKESEAALGYTRFKESDAAYIARLSPEVMKVVYEALLLGERNAKAMVHIAECLDDQSSKADLDKQLSVFTSAIAHLNATQP